MNHLYIVVETPYSGPTYCFEFGPCTNEDVRNRCEQAKEAAFIAYEVENPDVPSDILYASVFVSSVSSYCPLGTWDVFIKV